MRNLSRRFWRWTEDSPPLTRKQFCGAFVLLFALVTVALVGVHVLIARNSKAVTALCGFRAGLTDDIARQDRQLELSRNFLKRHPHGAFGFTVAEIRQSIANDEADLARLRRRRSDLSILDCKEAR